MTNSHGAKMSQCINQQLLDEIFPPERADAFFDAIYGGAEDGAYDIELICQEVGEERAALRFCLKRRQGHCLKCSLTYGLPAVFQRHPVIDINNVAQAVAHILGWNNYRWEMGAVVEESADLHYIPFTIFRG